jgi:hypothetical protein
MASVRHRVRGSAPYSHCRYAREQAAPSAGASFGQGPIAPASVVTGRELAEHEIAVTANAARSSLHIVASIWRCLARMRQVEVSSAEK